MDSSPSIYMRASATNVVVPKRPDMRERLNRSLELNREKSALQRQSDGKTASAWLQAIRYLRLSDRALLNPGGHWSTPSFESSACLFS